MAFMTLNGLSVRANSATGQPDGNYTNDRTVNGAMFRNDITQATKWPVSTAPFPLSDALAIKSWIRGRGHRWSFDDSTYYEYSKKGAGIASGTYSRATGGIGPKFGDAYLDVTASTTINMGTAYSSTWTVAYWTNVGGSWVHYIETSTGEQWEDGVSSTYLWSIAMSGGTLTLASGEYDDVAILPYVITEDMGDNWPQSTAFSNLPRLTAQGEFYDGVGTATVEVACDPPTLNYLGKLYIGGSFQQAASLSFDVREADAEAGL